MYKINVAMVIQTMVFIKSLNLLHLIICQLKIEAIKILLHAFHIS